MAEDVYPMRLFVKLSVRDVAASAKWYQEALGFRSVYAYAGDGGAQTMAHMRLGRYQDLMLIAQTRRANESNNGQGLLVNLALEEGIDALAQRAKAGGGRVEGPPDGDALEYAGFDGLGPGWLRADVFTSHRRRPSF